MKRAISKLVLVSTHTAVLGTGFGLGVYMLPILTAPESPSAEQINVSAEAALFTGVFRRELADSDLFHWGEGTLYVGETEIALQGRIAPGPDYRLYLSPEFVESEADFEALKPRMVHVGHVRTFKDFAVDVPEGINAADFTTAIVWCESFGQFITAAQYR